MHDGTICTIEEQSPRALRFKLDKSDNLIVVNEVDDAVAIFHAMEWKSIIREPSK